MMSQPISQSMALGVLRGHTAFPISFPILTERLAAVGSLGSASMIPVERKI